MLSIHLFMVGLSSCISCILSFQLPPTTVRILLNHFKWNKAKLMERYYGDSEEQEKMFKDAKVVSPLQNKAGGSGVSKKSSDSCECEICCLTLPKKVGTYARRIVNRFFFGNMYLLRPFSLIPHYCDPAILLHNIYSI